MEAPVWVRTRWEMGNFFLFSVQDPRPSHKNTRGHGHMGEPLGMSGARWHRSRICGLKGHYVDWRWVWLCE